MIKAIGNIDGRETLLIGLSFGNLDKFRREPLDTFIKIDGREIGLTHDVLLFSGETEAAMADMVVPMLSADAKVHISEKLKS